MEERRGKWDFRRGSAGRGARRGRALPVPGRVCVCVRVRAWWCALRGVCVCVRARVVVCAAGCVCVRVRAPPRGCHSRAPYLGQLGSKSRRGGSGSAGPGARAAAGGGLAAPRPGPPIGRRELSGQPSKPIRAADIAVTLISLIIINPPPTPRRALSCLRRRRWTEEMRPPPPGEPAPAPRARQPPPRAAGGAVRSPPARSPRVGALEPGGVGGGGGGTSAPVSSQCPRPRTVPPVEGRVPGTGGRGTLVYRVSRGPVADI